MGQVLFYVGRNRFAIESQFILRIIPKVYLKPVPYPLYEIGGLLNYEGKLIPIIDFCQLIENRPTVSVMRSRIILLSDTKENPGKILGVLGEKVEDFVNLNREDFKPVQFPIEQVSYLDKVYDNDQGVIRLLNVTEFFHVVAEKILKKQITS